MQIQSEQHIYTVSELTKEVRMILESAFPSIWIEGELSNFMQHSSGHMYFSLKDEGAVLNCAMFKGENRSLQFQPKDGLKVICSGRIGVYDRKGNYQFYAKKMEPKGLGALQLAFQQLKEKLEKEGLFDQARKKQIPFLPRRIGVVTSPTGAAIRDILNVTRRRYQNAEIIINPVRVQGDNAAGEIANAIKEFNEYKKIDVMIIGRGGGSLEDLWAFNEEVVARAIAASDIPIISAVGHEVDFTIADFVSDFRAPTPSAAAELVIPRKEDLNNRIENSYRRLSNAYLQKLKTNKDRLNRLKNSYILREPYNLINQLGQRIDDLFRDLVFRAENACKLKSESFKNVAGKLEALSPLSVLSRGYSVTLKLPKRGVVKGVKSINEGDRIETILHKGKFTSIVEKIQEGREE